MALGSENGLSASDVALLSGNNRGGNGAWNGEWLIALIVLFMFPMMFGRGGMFGNGGNGNDGGNGSAYIPYAISTNGALTRADLCEEFNNNSLQNAVRGIQQGICDGFYAMQGSINNLCVNVMQGFNGVNQGLCNLGYNMQQGFNATQVAMMQGDNATQLAITQGNNAMQMAMMQGNNALQAQFANCCCENRAGQADIKYQMATDTCAVTTAIANSTRDTIDNQNSNARAILDALNQNYIRTLESENQSLKLSASQQAQNAAIGAMISASEATILRRTGAECPTPAYVVQPPTPVNFPTNCCGTVNFGGNGCGNGCGC